MNILNLLQVFINYALYFIYWFLKLLIVVLIIGCLLSWVPNINWYKQPLRGLKIIMDTIFAPFRKIIPPIGGILDLSPLWAILFIQLIMVLVTYLFRIGG